MCKVTTKASKRGLVCVSRVRIFVCVNLMGKIETTSSAKISRPSPSFMPKTPARGETNDDRSKTHGTASPSPRCGFGWVRAELRTRLQSWMEEDARDCKVPLNVLSENELSYKCLEVRRESLPHLIGKGGHVLRTLEDFCGVFIAIRDLDEKYAEVTFTGPRHACVLAHFCGDLIKDGHYSVMITLFRNGI